MRLPFRTVATLAVLAAGIPEARAQDARSYVRWTAAPAPVDADGRATLRLRGDIADGWKLYALTSPPPAPALRVRLPEAVRLEGSASHPSTPEAVYDSLLGVQVDQFRGRVDLQVPVSGLASSGEVGVDVRFAVCDASICLAPRTATVAVPLVPAAPPPVAPATSEPVRSPGLSAAPARTGVPPAGPADTARGRGATSSDPAAPRGTNPPDSEPPVAETSALDSQPQHRARPSDTANPDGRTGPGVGWWGAVLAAGLVALGAGALVWRRR